jgi:hypothetical protein
MERVTVGKLVHVDVHTPKIEANRGPAVQVPVKVYKDRLTLFVDRAVGQSNEIKVADTRNVVAHRQRPSHEKVEDPAKLRKTIRQVGHRRRYVGHAGQLRSDHFPSDPGASGNGTMTEHWVHQPNPRTSASCQ